MDSQERSSMARFTRKLSISSGVLSTTQGMDRSMCDAQGLGEITSNHGSMKVARLLTGRRQWEAGQEQMPIARATHTTRVATEHS